MEVKRTVVGNLSENCYLVKEKDIGLIIDPGDDIDKILDMIGDTKILGILITHAHFDHVGALDDLLKKYDVPVYYHNVNNELNKNIIDIKEEEYKTDNLSFKVIYTPGHRNDSVIYYFEKEKIMFTGDFLFYLSIGRTDFEYGDIYEMNNSINKIKKYDDDITIYPGHGTKTTLKFEKEYNNYLK